MNEINAQQRLREANSFKAEAEKILLVKAAEADSESKHMTGVGIARQRKALVDGLSDTVAEYTHEVAGTTPKDVMDLLLLTQYFGMPLLSFSLSLFVSVLFPSLLLWLVTSIVKEKL
jgi:hypothetical protein